MLAIFNLFLTEKWVTWVYIILVNFDEEIHLSGFIFFHLNYELWLFEQQHQNIIHSLSSTVMTSWCLQVSLYLALKIIEDLSCDRHTTAQYSAKKYIRDRISKQDSILRQVKNVNTGRSRHFEEFGGAWVGILKSKLTSESWTLVVKIVDQQQDKQ